MTSAGRHIAKFEALTHDIAELARIVQGLAIHEFVAEPMYGFVVPEARRFESHLRRTEHMLDRLFELDGRPLTVARPPEKRLIGVCHHFTLFLVAMLRAQGVPARARCGFGSYFNPGWFEDHWVCEYWNATESRWILADPQFDEVWREKLHVDHDYLDVPRDRFLVASDAWTACRSGRADAAKFGIFKGNLRGLWFIAGDLIRDAASLGKTEMLPWDVWGAMPRQGETLSNESLAFFDELALLTRTPDQTFAELRERFENDERVRVPPFVFNAMLNR